MCRGRQVRDGGAYGCAVPRAYANLNPGLGLLWIILLTYNICMTGLLFFHGVGVADVVYELRLPTFSASLDKRKSRL